VLVTNDIPAFAGMTGKSYVYKIFIISCNTERIIHSEVHTEHDCKEKTADWPVCPGDEFHKRGQEPAC
jgi:hypothetical protein